MSEHNGRRFNGVDKDPDWRTKVWQEPAEGEEVRIGRHERENTRRIESVLGQEAIWAEPGSPLREAILNQVVEESRVEGAKPEVEGPNPIPMPYELETSTEPFATGWPRRRDVVDPEIIQRAKDRIVRENRAKQQDNGEAGPDMLEGVQ